MCVQNGEQGIRLNTDCIGVIPWYGMLILPDSKFIFMHVSFNSRNVFFEGTAYTVYTNIFIYCSRVI